MKTNDETFLRIDGKFEWREGDEGGATLLLRLHFGFELRLCGLNCSWFFRTSPVRTLFQLIFRYSVARSCVRRECFESSSGERTGYKFEAEDCGKTKTEIN